MHHTAQEIQDFVNNAERNFSRIRSTSMQRPATISYNEHEVLTGSAHRVTAHNALPIRTYPIELPMGWLD